MRIAFVDLNFSWPANGGADIDLFFVIRGLQARGHEVHLFVAHEKGSTERGRVNPVDLPFPCSRLDFTRRTLRPKHLCATFRARIDAWRPSLVFIAHGFALKPHLTLALAHHRVVLRYYAHELACARNACRFKDGITCPYDFLRTPQVCRECAAEHLAPEIRSMNCSTWTSDYLAARAYAPGYPDIARKSLRAAAGVIVSNTSLKVHLDGFHDCVRVVPGGVSATAIKPQAVYERAPGEPHAIFAAGRLEDPMKGLEVLREAGRLLARKRHDFEIWATHFDRTLTEEPFCALGWRSHDETLAACGQSDIIVVPSLWEEPFGLVAVEAMACARPVCASAVGGLLDIVRQGETGFHFEPGNAAELAKELDILLDNPALRRRMGLAGRAVVEKEYDWDRVIERHYLPLLEDIAP